MIIAATRANPASRAGNFSGLPENLQTEGCLQAIREEQTLWGIGMPRGRSTFTKRQKEQKRQQKQRDKAERRVQRKQDKPEGSVDNVDEMRELREHAEAQAALFNIGSDEPSSAEPPSTGKAIDR
jgi:hypothetical protein